MVTFTPPPTKPVYSGDGAAYSAAMVAYVMDWLGDTFYDDVEDFAAELATFAPSVTAALAGVNYKGVYNAGTTYQVSQSVSYGGTIWIANTVNLGVTPVAGANWSPTDPLTARTISAGTGLSGGGNLTADRTISADIASQAEAEAGVSTTKLMTPQRVKQAITALGGRWTQLAQTTVSTPVASATTTTPADISAYSEILVAAVDMSHNNGSSTTLTFETSTLGVVSLTSTAVAANVRDFWVLARRIGSSNLWVIFAGAEGTNTVFNSGIGFVDMTSMGFIADVTSGSLDAGTITIYGK